MSDLLPVRLYDNGISIVDVHTGEVTLPADASIEQLANAADYLAEQGRIMRSARSVVQDELIARLGRARSISAGRFAVEANERREWDPGATWQALSDLVVAGLVDAHEANDAMPEVTVRKPDGRKLNAILTRLVGEDATAAAPLAQARSSSKTIKVTPTAVDSTASAVA